MNTPLDPRAASRGFTLVELLVVIVIFAVLLTTMLPSWTRARDAARLTACSAQLRNLSVAMSLYVGAYGGQYPKATGNPGGLEVAWNDLLAEFDGRNRIIRDDSWLRKTGTSWDNLNDIYRCPAEQPEDKLRRFGMGGGIREHYTCTYRLNTARAHLPGSQENDTDGFPWGISSRTKSVSAGQIPEPSKTLLLTERRAPNEPLGFDRNHINHPGSDSRRRWGSLDIELANAGWTYLHDNGKKMNFLLVDGHIETHKPLETVGSGTPFEPGGFWTRRVND